MIVYDKKRGCYSRSFRLLNGVACDVLLAAVAIALLVGLVLAVR